MKNNVIIPVYNYVECNPVANPIKGFNMNRSTYLVKPEGITEPHRRVDYSVTLVISGELTQYIDFEKYTIKAPALLLLSPDQIHQFMGDSLCEVVTVAFEPDFFREEPVSSSNMICWAACVFQTPVIQLTDGQLKELMSFTKLMLKETEHSRPLREMIVRNLLNTLLAAIARLPQREVETVQADNMQNRIVRHFMELSDVHFKDKTQVTHYADMMYVTPGHLNDTIKSVVGKTAKQIIDEKRITEAKRLLFWNEHSIKEIAWQLNFEDDGYFNRFFKKHTGHTPAVFQKSIREKYN
jgi:AraC-like DNA-binding protein/quercetin dioxygenase-like cupin family protein